jgi:tRNA threonylcarbamoyladenosine biosynthesis protein TsaE
MSEALTITSAGPGETDRLAASLVPFLRAGDILLLSGDLGAGKTAFTQGLARAAGVVEPVTSPTFTLLRSYPTSLGLDLLHVDVYRLETTTAMADLGLSELIEDDAFAVVEWGERAVSVLGPEHLAISIATLAGGALSSGHASSDTLRSITLRPSGVAWRARWAELEAAVSALPSASGAQVTA